MATIPTTPVNWWNSDASAEAAFHEFSNAEIQQILNTPKPMKLKVKDISDYGFVTKEPEMKLQSRLVFPYNNYSKGAKALAKELGWQFAKREELGLQLGSLVDGSYDIINWGNVIELKSPGAKLKVLNRHEAVAICASKLKFFRLVKDTVRVPEFTDNLEEALKWAEDGYQVMGRRSHGSCGKDIRFYEDDLNAFSTSEFWVKYKKKKSEFRVHIAFGKIIAVQQKSLRTHDLEGNKIDTSTVDYRIRNLSHGFIFKRHDIAPPSDVMNQAAAAIKTVGLDFGAVDVIYNGVEDKAYVLEINTAPGLEGTTVQDYANAFREHYA